MKQLLQDKFLLSDYYQILFKQVESCSKKNKTLPHIPKSSIGFPLTTDYL